VQRFTIKYEQARDYPIDLYYLMDLTYSMKEHKEKLVELADSLGIPMFEKKLLIINV
jgi:protocadherin alpha